MINVIGIINQIFFSNSYIVYDDVNKSEAIMIDCGDLDKVLKMKKKYNTNIKCVFITHSHYDHIYGLNNLLCVYPNVEIFASERGIKGLYNTKDNLSKYFENPFIYSGQNCRVLVNDQKCNPIPKVLVDAKYTPGHDASSMILAINSEYLFTGDSYLPNNKTITSLPGGDKVNEKKSKQIIESMISNYKYIYPGHGNILEL